MNLELKL